MKRKRGAPFGNQNARKHGLYCGPMTPDEMCDFWNIVNTESIDPAVAALRVKIIHAVQREPGNRRLLRDAAKLLTLWYSAKFHLNRKDTNLLRKAVLNILVAGRDGVLVDFYQKNSSLP